jgi:hypothetical protein
MDWARVDKYPDAMVSHEQPAYLVPEIRLTHTGRIWMSLPAESDTRGCRFPIVAETVISTWSVLGGGTSG